MNQTPHNHPKNDIEEGDAQVIELEDEFSPNQYSNRIKQKQKLFRSLKVGIGVLLTSLTVLIESWDEFFHGTGQWAVITVVIVILDTPGDTARKITNRFVGTLVAALLALAVGSAGHEMSKMVYPTGELMVSIAIVAVGLLGTWVTSKGGNWAYAVSLGTATFPFMTLDAMRDDQTTAIFRTVMIAIGGAVGLILAWVPPTVKASEVAKACLADELVDTAGCIDSVVSFFLEGRRLNSVKDIYAGQEDDRAHELYKAVVLNRTLLESAVKSSKWESSIDKRPLQYKDCGLAVRLVLRAIQAADMLLRTGCHPLNQRNDLDWRFACALKRLVNCIQQELLGAVWDLGITPPANVESTNSNSDLVSSVVELHSIMDEIKSANMGSVERFSTHVAFARLLADAGSLALQVRPSLNQDKEGTISSDKS